MADTSWKLTSPEGDEFEMDDLEGKITHVGRCIVFTYIEKSTGKREDIALKFKRIAPQKVKPICPRPAGPEPGIVTVIRGREQR